MSNEIRVTVRGWLAKDPRGLEGRDGHLSAMFRLGCTARRRDADGTWKDGPTEWFTVFVNNRTTAHNALVSLRRGQPVIVTGRMRSSEWTRADGSVSTGMVIHAEAVGHDLQHGRADFYRVTPSGEPASDAAGAGGAHPGNRYGPGSTNGSGGLGPANGSNGSDSANGSNGSDSANGTYGSGSPSGSNGSGSPTGSNGSGSATGTYGSGGLAVHTDSEAAPRPPQSPDAEFEEGDAPQAGALGQEAGSVAVTAERTSDSGPDRDPWDAVGASGSQDAEEVTPPF